MIELSTRTKYGAAVDLILNYAPIFPKQFNLFAISNKDEIEYAIGCIQSVKGYFNRAINTYSKNRGVSESDVALEPLMRRVHILDDSLKIAYKQRGSLSSPVVKSAVFLYGPVQKKSRYCPDHVGVGVYRLADDLVQCPMDGKTYNYALGFEKIDGSRELGGAVQNQILKDPIMYTMVPHPKLEVIKK